MTRINRILVLTAVTSLLSAATLCVNSQSPAFGSGGASPQAPSTVSRMEEIVQDSVSRKAVSYTHLTLPTILRV